MWHLMFDSYNCKGDTFRLHTWTIINYAYVFALINSAAAQSQIEHDFCSVYLTSHKKATFVVHLTTSGVSLCMLLVRVCPVFPSGGV